MIMTLTINVTVIYISCSTCAKWNYSYH